MQDGRISVDMEKCFGPVRDAWYALLVRVRSKLKWSRKEKERKREDMLRS